MTVALPAGLFLSTFLMIAWGAFSMMLGAGVDQTDALREASKVRAERLQTRIVINSTSAKIITVGSGKCSTSYLAVDAAIANSGDVPIVAYPYTDVVMSYVATGGTKTAIHPAYVSGSLSAGTWTIQDIDPDNYDVGAWDPDETATLRTRPDPLPEPHSLGTVLVGTPNGVTHSAYVDFDYDSVGSNDCRYLHNNPTPPTGDTNRQADLSMDETVSTATSMIPS